LIVVSVALGASTAWLAIELRATRQELTELRGSSAAATTRPAPTAVAKDTPAAAVHADAAASRPPTQPAHPRDAMQARDDAAQRAANLANDVWVRSWIDDAEKRAKVLADSRKMHERDIPRQLLDLNGADYNRFLDIQAAKDLRYSEAMYRCNADPGCNLQTAIEAQVQANRRELVELLGDEKTQRLENYLDNAMERNGVASLRSALPDSMPMSDVQAEKLSDALGEERRRISTEWQQRGEQVSGMGNMWGWLSFPETADVQRRVADATEYQRRRRDRAAAILTSAQLEIFTKQQEQMLEIARGSWEYEAPAGN
jgi:hypothetical protein